jgi:hypothetical protein
VDINTVVFVTYTLQNPRHETYSGKFNEHIEAVQKNTANSKTDERLLNRKYYFEKVMKL